ncbi:TOMM precursor leader peptide-binding protein [Streptomyces sp. NRRL B-1677]|uniref:TOMM precursor leader peptide-binding protein n=1 Tax=Streptomyces TaxID=1883 RepID=UPI001892AD66|nr:TOMM precursor leader peptide-binding protein [Streptomyces sp. NRRL B-1677]MBF6047094.1 TOMM precursor leader peptide-binding protein [Streptomyces sp. NRRL B-1677]
MTEPLLMPVVHLLPGPPGEEEIRQAEAEVAAGRTVVCSWWEPGRIVVGPAMGTGVPGCLRCFVTRCAACRPEAFPRIRERAGEGSVTFADRHALLTSMTDDLVRQCMTRDAKEQRPHRAFLTLRLKDFSVTPGRFLPVPLCPVCSDAPDDAPPAEAEFDVPIPKRAPGHYRSADLVQDAERLRKLYVDEDAGLVRRLRRSAHGLFPTATAPTGIQAAASQEIGFGRQTSYLAAEVTALAEGLERAGGVQPGGRRTVTHGSWASLRADAVDPRRFGLHDPEQYLIEGFPFQEFTEDLELSWVWGRSLVRERSVLIPECLAYYEPLYRPTGRPVLAYEISNGCALGASPAEAALHGIFEIAERDAFLLTWYSRLSPVEVTLDPRRDTELALMAERIEWLSGYRVRLYDITNDLGIPAVWVLAVDEAGRAGQPRALCAGGAHLDLRRAFRSALLELAPFTAEFPPAYRSQRHRVTAMLEDPGQVRHMEDHRLLYCAPEAFERLEFLLRPRERMSLAEAGQRHLPPDRHLDLRQDLSDAVQRIAHAGLDVLVVDQTTPDHRLGGFRCAKVLVPGAVPMTFGHWARRLNGLERLLHTPVALGQAAAPLTRADLNPHPHPFP